jgi:hypothetical protein
MSKPGAKKPHGQLRQGQLISTFGPGAMLDLPNHSVLVAGLEHWAGVTDEIVEPRLAANAANLLGVPSIKLYAPPADSQDPTAPINGIGAWQFPEWFIVQKPIAIGATRSRLMVRRSALNRGKYIDHDKKRLSVVPIRFVRACPNGHIGDIEWHTFVHGASSTCMGRPLWIDERGTSGDLSEVWIRCDCKLERNMSQASKTQDHALGHCNGARPWLGALEKEKCGAPNRLLIRNASNAYFPQLLSVISLPDRDEKIKHALDSVWEDLEAVESLEELQYERKKARIKSALQDISDDEVLKELKTRKTGFGEPTKTVKVAELETLLASKEEIGSDIPHGNFLARRLSKEVWQDKAPWMKKIENVVLVHRLREVVAQVGFSRFEAVSTNIEGELEIGARRAAISRTNTWLPAMENKGEGIFIQFKKSELEEWSLRTASFRRGKQLEGGFNAWKEEHKESHREYPKLPYLFLHSFSHLLITAVALECGYPASSIRERIYAFPDVGYGILLYTASSDAEGTLGGLVEVGRRIHLHVRSALQLGELCSNDPVCAEHRADNDHERRFLHGAACHGCLLIAETSCEQHNDFLDRALVVPTLENMGAEFFKSDEL